MGQTDNYVSDSLMKQQQAAGYGGIRQLTVRENLQERKDRLTEQLDALNSALSALDANPAVEEVLTVLAKVQHF